ncbi:MAG TPA: GDP-L-fucose synthase [Acidobacteriaceae bacterium]|nr:GDP-L-fucose synthase [Acidobacteriaceae bacterium]
MTALNNNGNGELQQDSRIYVAGHCGLVGSAIRHKLEVDGCTQLLLPPRAALDLTRRDDVMRYFNNKKPEFVFLAAAKVGGIHANSTYPADFIRDNLLIQCNVIDACFEHGVKRLLFLGSSCIYPRDCPQPMREEYLLTGPLEPTNRPYALAKIAGIEQCWAYNRQYGTQYLAAMPTNLYGLGDNFDLENSHVLPALVRKVATAKAKKQKQIVVWGTGNPRREFLYSDDLAEACVMLLRLPQKTFQSLLPADQPPLINIGVGEDVTIRELVDTICSVLDCDSEVVFDATKPDGTPRKLLDVTRMHALGWSAHTSLAEGILRMYASIQSVLPSW